jgi:glycine cleavage system H protein
MSIPADLKYTDSHEWVRLDADGNATVGITHHAQDLLGDLVFVEPPKIGRKLRKGEECGVVESVKAASDIYAPIGGEVVAVNAELETAPEKINQGAYQAWMFKLKPADAAEMASLLDAAAYQKLVEANSK